MNSCERIQFQITAYLEGELPRPESRVLENHIQTCRECRTALEQERCLAEEIRNARPLYKAPPALRLRVEQTLENPTSDEAAPIQLKERVERVLATHEPKSYGPKTSLARRRLFAAAALVLLAVLGAAGYWSLRQTTRTDLAVVNGSSEFGKVAALSHIQYKQDGLDLEIVSDSPEVISGWFSGKLPFEMKLPNYQESSGQERLYELKGARLLSLSNGRAAYVGYEMRQRPISLIVTSTAAAEPSGGERILSKGLTFHYELIEGLKVITWMDRGLTYALVSEFEERGQETCIVCHEGTKDRDFIEGLKPRL